MKIITNIISPEDFAILVKISEDGCYGTYSPAYGKTGEYETYRISMGSVFRYVNVKYDGLPETIITKDGKLRDGDWNLYQRQCQLVESGIDIHVLIGLGVYRHGHGMDFYKLRELIKEYRDEDFIKEVIVMEGYHEAYNVLLAKGIAADKLFFL